MLLLSEDQAAHEALYHSDGSSIDKALLASENSKWTRLRRLPKMLIRLERSVNAFPALICTLWGV